MSEMSMIINFTGVKTKSFSFSDKNKTNIKADGNEFYITERDFLVMKLKCHSCIRSRISSNT